VGAMVRQLLDEGRDVAALSIAEWRQHSALFGDDVGAAVTAEASVRARKTPQSTAPASVAAALDELQRWLLAA
jgi:argininosuccinate lyase